MVHWIWALPIKGTMGSGPLWGCLLGQKNRRDSVLCWKPSPASPLVPRPPPLDYRLPELQRIQIHTEGTNPLGCNGNVFGPNADQENDIPKHVRGAFSLFLK